MNGKNISVVFKKAKATSHYTKVYIMCCSSDICAGVVSPLTLHPHYTTLHQEAKKRQDGAETAERVKCGVVWVKCDA